MPMKYRACTYVLIHKFSSLSSWDCLLFLENGVPLRQNMPEHQRGICWIIERAKCELKYLEMKIAHCKGYAQLTADLILKMPQNVYYIQVSENTNRKIPSKPWYVVANAWRRHNGLTATDARAIILFCSSYFHWSRICVYCAGIERWQGLVGMSGEFLLYVNEGSRDASRFVSILCSQSQFNG